VELSWSYIVKDEVHQTFKSRFYILTHGWVADLAIKYLCRKFQHKILNLSHSEYQKENFG
jgi:hypothetical protein